MAYYLDDPNAGTMFNIRDNLKHLSVPQIKERALEDRLPYDIMLLNTSYDINIGNCIRSSHLLGVRTVYILGTRKYDRRSSVGAQNYTQIVRYKPDTPFDCAVINFLKTNNLLPLFIEQTDHSKSIAGLDFREFIADTNAKSRLCLVFGNESDGIPANIMHLGSVWHIPQRGVIRSFNLASACSIVCWTLANILTEI